MELKVWVSIAYHNKSNTFMKSHYLSYSHLFNNRGDWNKRGGGGGKSFKINKRGGVKPI